jgi:DNA replication protein DnaC
MTENLDDEFDHLRRIAEAAQQRARAAGVPIGNLGAIKPRMTAQDFLAALPVATDADADEYDRNQRNVEARAVRGMLPEFLRAPSVTALTNRVAERDFLSVVNAWAWGCGNLLLLGPTGSGRSTAAACLFRRLLAIGVRDGGEAWANAKFMAWFHAGDLAEARREHSLGKGEAPEIGQASRARLLVLDDAGWEQDPFVCSMILKERYELGAPTIITSGKTEGELIQHYGAAVVRRMTETGGRLPGGGIMSRFPEGAA